MFTYVCVPPTSKKLRGHIASGLSCSLSIRPYASPFVMHNSSEEQYLLEF